ncbi:DUF4389 domain-containing protein [Nocardioides islandensis]|jgi:hypothetical protein|uniref:DUF4389 domain-containing protein n=1 Tax=Nocardioides islandensis TaxID=433663 RepID=A0A930YGA3_9ACTN|nr:DUF4389 domain-containing protein [Nocardioides islandensis]MBF4765792.1 DUF4389 domain-containing protein [Nocardioides islandensis]
MSAVTYPVHVDAELDNKMSRWLWLLKWLLVIPHYVVLAFLWIAFVVLSVVAFFAILFTGRYPRSIFEFNVGVLRWQWRVSYYAYGALGTDRYPPFTLREVADYPAHLQVDYPERLSRGLVLVKWWLLAIPHYLVVGLLVGGAGYFFENADDRSRLLATGLIPLLACVAGVVLLVTGRYPQALFDLLLGLNRWVLRVAGYAALMTDTYPPFRLDQGGHEGGTGTVTFAPAPTPSTPAAPTPEAPAAPAPTPPAPTGAPPLPRTTSRWTTGRITSVVAGCVFAVVTLGLLVPGVGLLVADHTLRDDNGFLMSPEQTLETSTYAILSGEQMQVGAPWELPPAALLGDLKITASAGESADVFIGIAPTSDVETYLAGVEHVTLVDVRDGDGVYRTTAGDGRPGAPASQDFWATTSAGPGTQELTWEPTNGDWSVLVMNADASKGVDVVVTAGAEVPALPWIVAVMLSIAGLTLVASVILIAVPLRRVGRTSGDR